MNYLYGALLLHKQGKEVNRENVKKLIEATGGEVDEGKIKVLVESLRGVDIDKELEQATIMAMPAAPAITEDKAKEEKKEEKKEEAAEGLSALFG